MTISRLMQMARAGAPEVYAEETVQEGLIVSLDAADIDSYSGSGSTWFDRTINANNATLTNGPVYSSDDSGYFTFDGVNDYADLPTNFFPYPTISDFTITLWFRSSQTTGGTLFGQQNVTPPSNVAQGHVAVIYLTTNGTIRVEPFWTGSTQSDIFSSAVVNDNAWHSVTTTYSSGTNRLYVDGVFQSQQTGLTLKSYGSTYYYFIGATRFGRGNGTPFFSGDISLFFFYDRVLSDPEIAQNHTAAANRYGI